MSTEKECSFSEVDSQNNVLRKVMADLRSQTERMEQLTLIDTGQSVKENCSGANVLPTTGEITDFIFSCDREINGDQHPSVLDSARLIYLSRRVDKAVRMLGELLLATQEQLSASLSLLRLLQQRKNSYKKKVEKLSCYFCGEKGHFKRHCQKRQQSGYQGVRY